MPDLATLRDIQRRLREATGPDREIDAAIFDAFGLVNEDHVRSWCRRDGRPDLTRACYLSAWADHFTNQEDIGKTISLIERVLPQCAYLFGKSRESADDPLYCTVIYASMSQQSESIGIGTHPAHLAIALCLALVSALMATEEEKERDHA